MDAGQQTPRVKLDPKILLIEDDPGDAALFKRVLKFSRFADASSKLVHHEWLRAALSEIYRNDFDLIITDMNLPDSFGMNTIHEVLGATRTPVSRWMAE